MSPVTPVARLGALAAAGILLATLAACNADRSLASDPVSAVPVDGAVASIAFGTVNLVVGESRQLTPSSATRRSRSLVWHSSNATVATVSSTGLVRAVGAGTTTISAIGNRGYDTWPVSVAPTPPPAPPTPPPATGPLGLNADLGRRLLPADNPWNQPVDTAQVDPNSAAIIANIGATKAFQNAHC
jgi:hypothetical protein